MVVSAEAGAGGVKGQAVRMFAGQPRSADGLSDEAVYCGGANAVHIAVFVAGASPSATITVEGSDEQGGNYLQLPDSNARQAAVAASFTFEVNVGTQWARVRLGDRTGGTFTIVVTPYVSAGSRQRPQFYDRNPVASHAAYDVGDTAPHVATDRFTYTVPAGRKALLGGAFCRVIRDGAPSATGIAQASIFVEVSSTSYRFLAATIVDGAVGAKDAVAVGQTVVMSAGDGLRGATYDTSTGGTVRYNLSAMITEFDA